MLAVDPKLILWYRGAAFLQFKEMNILSNKFGGSSKLPQRGSNMYIPGVPHETLRSLPYGGWTRHAQFPSTITLICHGARFPSPTIRPSTKDAWLHPL